MTTIPLSATDGPLFESCDTGEDGSRVNVAGRRALAPATRAAYDGRSTRTSDLVVNRSFRTSAALVELRRKARQRERA